MYQFNSVVFEATRFLQQDWQKQPRVFRQVFADFQDPISADELAGVALEPGVDSRLVVKNKEKWHVQHGPIEDFSEVPETGWSLLVQAVNEHFPPAQALLQPFRFLPDWRIDDLMVSYSTPQGGVGAHLDQYDVFIIQGSGQRRWRIGSKGDYKTVLPHEDLKQIEGFEADIDVVLEPGDMLYIPAGFPHEGESLTECLNYSVGFRAPSQAELISELADYALENEQLAERFTGSVVAPQKRSWEIQPDSLQQFRELLVSAFNNESLLDEVISRFLSKNPRPPLLVWPQDKLTESGLIRYLQQHDVLQRAVGLRMLSSSLNGSSYALVQGQTFELDAESTRVFEALVGTDLEIPCSQLVPLLKSGSARRLLLEFIQEGFWFAVNDEDKLQNEQV